MKPLEILSFGAGVQSTALLLLSLSRAPVLPGGRALPWLDHVIFADTGWEPAAVYQQLEWCRARCETEGVPFHIVKKKNIRADILEAARQQRAGMSGSLASTITIPAFFRDDRSDEVNILSRYCTSNYKVNPLYTAVNAIRGRRSEQRVHLWIGISVDEIERMKVSRRKWMTYRHPLSFDPQFRDGYLQWTRAQCLKWMGDNGYPLPQKSSCIGCPYRGKAEWKAVRADPVAWRDAVEVDGLIRDCQADRQHSPRLYLHGSGVPLGEVDFDEAPPPLFSLLDECDGMCGL